MTREGEKWIKLIHVAHAKAAQAIEQHIAPGYEAGTGTCQETALNFTLL
jgi:hypothetical protein